MLVECCRQMVVKKLGTNEGGHHVTQVAKKISPPAYLNQHSTLVKISSNAMQ